MSLAEAAIRGGAMALMLLLVALLLRDGRGAPVARYAALFALGAAANLIRSAPALDGVHALWLAPLRILAFGNPVVFLVMASALFDDDFRPSWPHVAAWVALVGLNVAGDLYNGPWRFLPANALALLCILVALWRALAGLRGDLVEARRRLRVVFVGAVGLFTVATIVSSVLSHGHPPSYAAVGEADAAGNLVLALYFAFRVLSLTPDDLWRPMVQPEPAARPASDDPRDAALMTALRRQMETERAYREEALGIGALASRLGVPEYRLRRLINRRLGHRNFAAFLNGYRLDEITAALSDPAQTEVPILTMALDAGFQSVGPFNRAFKARTGVTPTEYRRRQAAGA